MCKFKHWKYIRNFTVLAYKISLKKLRADVVVVDSSSITCSSIVVVNLTSIHRKVVLVNVDRLRDIPRFICARDIL